MNPDLTIIIPTLNEEKRIGATLDRLADYLKQFPDRKVEILVIDANSPDQTVAEANKRAKKFYHFAVLNAGSRPPGKSIKGKQVRAGMFEANGRYIMFMDADLATPLKYLKQVFDLIDNKKPVGICVRNLNESHAGLRKFISGFGNFLVQMLLVPGIKDTQCGFKAFDATAAKQIFSRQRIDGWGFDMEILALARKYGHEIVLIDVPDWRDVVEGSKISGHGAAKVAIQTFGDLLRIKWGFIIGRYRKPSYHHENLPKSI